MGQPNPKRGTHGAVHDSKRDSTQSSTHHDGMLNGGSICHSELKFVRFSGCPIDGKCNALVRGGVPPPSNTLIALLAL